MADENQPKPINLPDESGKVDDLAVKEGEAFSKGKFVEFAFKWEWAPSYYLSLFCSALFWE